MSDHKQQGHVNAMAHEHREARAADVTASTATGNVWVSQQFYGSPVTNVSTNSLYWMNLANGSPMNSVDFVVTYKAGSPLQQEHQHYSFPGGYGANISTPFAVAAWGGTPTTGPAVLTVLVNGTSVGSYNFTVV